MQDRHCRTAQFEYQGQTRYTRILDRKLFFIHIDALDIDFPLPPLSESLLVFLLLAFDFSHGLGGNQAQQNSARPQHSVGRAAAATCPEQPLL